jgi:hypothetical protein
MSVYSGNPEFKVEKKQYSLSVKWLCRICGRLEDRPYFEYDDSSKEPLVDENTVFSFNLDEFTLGLLLTSYNGWPLPFSYPTWECSYCVARRRFYL